MKRRIIAIGDLHGALDCLLEIVTRLGIVKRSDRSGAEQPGAALDLDLEESDLLFIGDVCDRGTDSRSMYEMIMRWQEQAPQLGSSVWFVLGNHEVMNSFGMRHYNTVEEYLSFDRSSRSAGERAHAAAFSPGGWLHEWLVRQHAVVRLGPYLFAHGDLPAILSDWSPEEIDARVLETYRNAAGAPSAMELPDALFAPERSVLWCREAQLVRPSGYAKSLKGFLARNDAAAWICGHTPAEEGSHHLLYGGRYLCIDTAMTFQRYGAGRTSALLIEEAGASALYFERGDLRSIPLELARQPPPD